MFSHVHWCWLHLEEPEGHSNEVRLDFDSVYYIIMAKRQIDNIAEPNGGQPAIEPFQRLPKLDLNG